MSPPCAASRTGQRISIRTGSSSPLLGRSRRRARCQCRGKCRRPSERGDRHMLSADYVNTFLFGIYPYLCLAVLLIGSLIRFDREPYTWKSDSSQLLRKGQLRLGSNLFHYGVIVVILGHFAGFLAPDWAIDWALSPVTHQLLAMVTGGIAGLVAIVGLTILIARRISERRVLFDIRT